MKITFYSPDVLDVDQFLQLDPDKDWKLFSAGQKWVAQTFFRLKRRGHQVHLANKLPDEGVVVYQQRHHDYLSQEYDKKRASVLILVCIRGDKSESPLADFEIVQNTRWENKKRFFYIPFWPQPDLLPRDKRRQNKVEFIAYKGFNTNIHKHFFEDDWKNWLKENDLIWCLDSQKFTNPTAEITADWNDYSSVDIIVAIRNNKKHRTDQKEGFTSKPAAKLYNAWHAGVPAILGPEYAYQQIRKTELDYIEVNNIEETKAAILHLKNNPLVYQSMIENGLKRAEEFSVDEITRMWENLLFDKLPQLIDSASFRLFRKTSMQFRIYLKRMNRFIAGRTER